MANVEATFDDPTGETIALSGDGFLNHGNTIMMLLCRGVSCTLCHQIENNRPIGNM